MKRWIQIALLMFIIGTLAPGTAFAQAEYRVAADYEDSLRVVILYNDDATGHSWCQSGTRPVGELTRDYILTSLDVSRVSNVIVRKTEETTWSQIQAMWGGDTLPHVIVHANAGWHSKNGPYLGEIFSNAVLNKIGVVSIGDDAAHLATDIFGFTGVSNVPQPMGDATSIDSLWIGLIRSHDEKLKERDPVTGGLKYPYVNGVISNAIDSILPAQRLDFYPYGEHRCQADADKYSVLPEYLPKLTYLGYQQGYKSGGVIGDYNELQVIVAIQDTIGSAVRRGVSLSFQPQFIRDSEGSQQVVYDAIMFASLAHTLSVPSKLTIVVEGDSLTAGDTLSLEAFIIDQFGDTLHDDAMLEEVRWDMLAATRRPGDQLLASSGGHTRFTATAAHRNASITATYDDNGTILIDTAVIWIKPASPHHLVIEGTANALSSSPNQDNPAGGDGSVTIASNESGRSVYAIIRDIYGNYVEHSQTTDWQAFNPAGIVTAAPGETALGEGRISRIGASGSAQVWARNPLYSLSDTVRVTVDDVEYDSLRIMVWDNASGRLVRIENLAMPTSADTGLYVEALPTVPVTAPGSDGWLRVAADWSLSGSLSATPGAPAGAEHWEFSPADTGSGLITVSLPGVPSKSIPAQFLAGAPASIALYPAAGTPGGDNASYPAAPVIADSVIAGQDFTRLYAKVFDANGVWLQSYETSDDLGNQISWTVAHGAEATLDAAAGGHNTIRVLKAYQTITLVAQIGGAAVSARFYVEPGPAHHLVIEGTATIASFTDDDPLTELVIAADKLSTSAYAVLRDQWGNFVGYGQRTRWAASDSAIFAALDGFAEVGEGIALRRADKGIAEFSAFDSTTGLSDTVAVRIQDIYYTAVDIRAHNGSRSVDSLSIRTDQDTALYAVGKRSDNGQWEEVAAAWDAFEIALDPTAPASSDRWQFSPADTGAGMVVISRHAENIADTIQLRIDHGAPRRLELYTREGAPLYLNRFPAPAQAVEVAAGDSLLIVANIFDHQDIWLRDYTAGAAAARIQWRVAAITGHDSPNRVTRSNGSSTRFTPIHAYDTVFVIAAMEGLLDSVRVAVAPGPAARLVIEARSKITDFRTASPATALEISPTDTVTSAFAVLRDAFGNFVDYSRETDWSSVDPAIVSAEEGVRSVGEGKIYRKAAAGETGVIAASRAHPGLADTVTAYLRDIFYDSLRIIDAAGNRLENMIMKTGEDTTLYVEGKRSDNGLWETIAGDWHASASLWVKPLPPARQISWSWIADQDGSGIIWVTRSGAAADSIRILIDPGEPASVRLYPEDGAPGPENKPLPGISSPVNVAAGSAFTMYAKVFDKNNRWLDHYTAADSGARISWQLLEENGQSGSGSLQRQTGASNAFTPEKAFRTVKVAIAMGTTLTDTVAFSIQPGPPDHVVIEASQDRNVSPHHDNPVDTVYLTSEETVRSIYAILRDRYGNFVRHSHITAWSSDDTTLVEAADGNSNIGEGFITRIGAAGVCEVIAASAEDLALTAPADSVAVKVLHYHYTELRIEVDGDNAPDTLHATTNDNAALAVYGRRSIDGEWEQVSASWEVLEGLSMTPAAPENSHAWQFSPNQPGTGWIRVFMSSASTAPDTLPVAFTPGKPVSAELDILTPPRDRRAGDTITAVVRIRNANGLVPETWRYPGHGEAGPLYHDALGNGGRDQTPAVLVDGQPHALGNRLEQCFDNGVDTVSFVLYYAPEDTDSLHTLSVTLDDVQAHSSPFVLLPGAIDSLALETVARKPASDTIPLAHPDGAVILVATGYDRFGNRIGPVKSDWATSGDLHPILRSENIQQIYYTAADVDDYEQGYITATAEGISDSAYIMIKGPGVGVQSARTRDLDGDGYLDAVEVRFDKPVTLPTHFSTDDVASYFDISYNSSEGLHEFIVDSVRAQNAAADSVYLVHFEEIAGGGPQTDWKPVLSMRRTGDTLDPVDDLVLDDGAGPVIWSVTKITNTAGDRTKDKIIVAFSEDIQGADGSPVRASLNPSELFNVWAFSQGERLQVDSVFEGIEELAGIGRDSLIFYMSNNGVLTADHYLSIKTSPDSRIADVETNQPAGDNRIVRVHVVGTIEEIVFGPNPVNPTTNHFQRELVSQDPVQAARWARYEGGTVMSVDIVFSGGGDDGNQSIDISTMQIRGKLIVFDGVGNAVYVRESRRNLLPEHWRTVVTPGEKQQLAFYWNGSTDQRRKADPGIYRALIVLEYNNEIKKFVSNVGIGR